MVVLRHIYLVGFCLLPAVFSQDGGPIVSVTSGALQGRSDVDRFNRTYEGFYGVPFAQPPVGDLRWMPAQRPEDSWEGVRDATEFAPHCIQVLTPAYPLIGLGGNDTEDCLYLNVYIPVSVDDALTKSLPVMFFFYGGAYLFGSAEMYPGQEIANENGVIVVTTTYRTSVMGFMSTADDAAPGNYGLWDGKAGLEWTVANIAAFGGNPTDITVFGHSAGAGMTMHSLLSPQTNTMFQKAIAISGSGTGITAFVENPMATTQHLADLFFCNTTDSAEIVACLRNVSAKSLDTLGLASILVNDSRVPNFMPYIDGDFVTQDTRVSVEQGIGGHIDLITGHTVHDGAAFALSKLLGAPPVLNFTRFNRSIDGNRDNEELHGFFLLMLGNTEDPEAMYQMLVDRYPDLNSTDDELCSRAATHITTYWFFTAAAHYEAEHYSRAVGGGNTYLYRFEYRPSFLSGYPDWVNGSHMDDLYSVFGDPFMKDYRTDFLDIEDFSPEDEQVGRNVRARFTNFAYSGDPNVGPNPPSMVWPDYSSGQFLVQSTEERMVSLTAEEVDEINWYLNVWWPLLKPETWGTASDDSKLERLPIDEEKLMDEVDNLRTILYEYVDYNDDVISAIDERILSALIEREKYRLE